MSSIVSNAYNFSEFINSGVDSRTGSYSISLSLGEFLSYKTSGLPVNLTLNYNAASSNDLGFGRGWAISLSSFSKSNSTLGLSSGQYFEIQWDRIKSEFDIPYRKIKDIRVFYIQSSNEVHVVHKDGRQEYIDYDDGYLKRMVSPHGLVVYFEYGTFNQQYVLYRIYDDSGRELEIDCWSDDYETVVRHKFNDDLIQEIKAIKRSIGGDSRLMYFYPQDENYISIKYRFISQSGYDVIETVTHLSGMVEEIRYEDKGHLLPEGAPISHAPRVDEYWIDAGENQDTYFVKYGYSDHNYLGHGGDQAWVAGEDTLFKTRRDYKYSIEEIINSERKTVYQYNKYHLLEKEQHYYRNNKYKESNYVYFADLDVSVEWQPAIYSMVKQKTVTYYREGVSRSFNQFFNYDEYGNQTYFKESDGSQTFSTFYSELGEGELCPPSPTGMASFTKSEVFVPNMAGHSEPERKVEMTYKAYPRLDDPQLSVVFIESTVDHNNQHQKFNYYSDLADIYSYGRVKSEVNTVNGYRSEVEYAYGFSSSRLTTTTVGTAYDGLTQQVVETIDYTHGEVVEATDPHGVVVSNNYDELGRLVDSTVSPDTDYAATVTHLYSVGSGANFVTEIDAMNNSVVTRLNNAGKVIRIQHQAANATELKTIQEFKYNAFGLLTEQTDTDWDQSSVLSSNTTYFEHDEEGEVNKVTHPDGRVEFIEQNPVELMATHEMEGLHFTMTRYDLAGLKVYEESRDSGGALLAKTDYKYDGYGNLRFTFDTEDRETEYVYDNYDRITKTIKTIDGEQVIESLDYADFTSSEVVTDISVDSVELGNRVYDGLMRLKSESSDGTETSYEYSGTSSNPQSIITARGHTLDIKYKPELMIPESLTVRGQAQWSSIYDYDKTSSLELNAGNASFDRVLLRDDYGRVREEKVELNNGEIRTAKYKYSELGLILESRDFFGNVSTYLYDDFGRLESVSEKASGRETKTVIEYDNFSRPWRYTMVYGADMSVVELAFNDVGMEVSRSAQFNGQEIFSIEQEYNARLLLETRTFFDSEGSTIEVFNYDELNRLESFNCSGKGMPQDEFGNTIVKQSFVYDVYGNITEAKSDFIDGSNNVASFDYPASNPTRLSKLTNSHHDYPSNITFRYDAAGNLLNDEQGREYEYNPLDQVTSVSDAAGSLLSRYKYGAGGQLVSQTVEDALVYLYYINGRLSNEYSDGSHSSYHYATHGLTGRSVTEGDQEQHQVLLGNSQSSTLEVLTKTKADQQTRVRSSRKYTPYGEG